MKRRGPKRIDAISRWCWLVLLFLCSPYIRAQPSLAANSGFESYVEAVEAELTQQHQSPDSFLDLGSHPALAESRLRAGELMLEQLTPAAGISVPGGLIHHWRGSAFLPQATAADFERLMKNFGGYPQHFAPEVMQARAASIGGDRFQLAMRIRQRHVITVVLDTEYEVSFRRLDPQHGYSISHSTRIAEIGSPGTGAERVLPPAEEHGFLWRLNTYWSFEERDGGLYMQVETVSLTRAIPRGLGWAVAPYVESIPRESLEFTLRAVCSALRR